MSSAEMSASMPLTVYVLVLAFVSGTVFGSFFNCMAWRIVHGESILYGRSHCAECGHPLAAKDLVPIFSYLALHGKCRYCGKKIAPRYTAVELICGTAFVITFLRFGLTVHTATALILLCMLLTLSLVDLDMMIIPDRFIVTMAGLWAVTTPFLCQEDKAASALTGSEMLLSKGIFSVTGIAGANLKGMTGGAAIGGGMLLLSLIFDKVTGKESMGGGDVKLFLIAGLFLGPWTGLLCLLMACVIGLAFAVAKKEAKIPFGPAISAAFFICFLAGQNIVNAYLGLFL